MLNLRSFVGVSAMSLLFLAGSANQAKADFTLFMSQGNVGGIDIYTGPYAQANFVQTGANTLTVTVTALNNGSQFFLFGDIGLNLAVGVSFGSVTSFSSPLGSSMPVFGFDSPPGQQIDGFGRYVNLVDGDNGGSNGYTTLTFTLTGFAIVGNGSSFLTTNALGNLMAMHINAYGNSNYTGGALRTGFGANGNITAPVPAPGGIALLASGGFASLGGLVFRRRNQKSA